VCSELPIALSAAELLPFYDVVLAPHVLAPSSHHFSLLIEFIEEF
jgi:hypothetical protein